VSHELFAGVPYEYASVVEAGSLVFTAGACPLERDGAVVAGDHIAQTHAALDNLVAVLDRHRAGLEHVVRTTIYVVGGRDDLGRVWEGYAARLAPHRPPSTLLGVAALGYAGQLVEIDAIAALPPT
jgi:enamine deaminase RidA (YjgF/YER057c/UK114 family)